MFAAEGTLYRCTSGTNLQAFVQADTEEQYTPKSGDYVERRAPDGAEHSMIILRWPPATRRGLAQR
jgi:hypothetical protein